MGLWDEYKNNIYDILFIHIIKKVSKAYIQKWLNKVFFNFEGNQCLVSFGSGPEMYATFNVNEFV